MSKRFHARPIPPCALRHPDRPQRTLRPIHWMATAALAALSLFVVPATPASAAPSSHPYFNDSGVLRWHVRYVDATRDAARQQKLVFVEAGRKRCTLCRRLCTDVLPHRSIRKRIARMAVGLVGDADRPEVAIASTIHGRFAGARTLPIAWFMTPDGRYVTGFWGKRTVSQLSRDLDVAERAWRRLRVPASPNPGNAMPGNATPDVRAPTRPRAPTTRPAPLPAPPLAAPGTDRGCAKAAPPPCGTPPTLVLEEECCEGEDCGIPEALRTRPGGVAAAPIAAAPGGDSPAVEDPGNVEDNGPAPRADAPRAAGSPDGEAVALSPDGPALDLPAPEIRAPEIRAPDGPVAGIRQPRKGGAVIHPTARGGSTLQRAQEAAARGQWGKVLSAIGSKGAQDPKLLKLTRQAHQWAHEQLDAAVRELKAGRPADARKAVDAVRAQMVGHPAAEDALRGLEAIEAIEDLGYLSTTSGVRRAVRRNAFERLRGSRWAEVFAEAK